MGKSSGDGGGEAEGLIAMAGGKGSSQVPDSRVDEVKALKQSTYLNMAACYIKREMYEKPLVFALKPWKSVRTQRRPSGGARHGWLSAIWTLPGLTSTRRPRRTRPTARCCRRSEGSRRPRKKLLR